MGQKLDTMTLAQGNLANDTFFWNSSNWPYSWGVASFHPYIKHCFTQQMPSFEIFGNMGWQIHTCLPEQFPLTGSWLSHLMAFCRRPLWWPMSLQQVSTVWRLLPLVVRWYPAGEDKTNSYKPDYNRRGYKPIVGPEVSTYKTDTDVDVLTLACWGLSTGFRSKVPSPCSTACCDRCPAMSMEVWGAPCEGCC